MKGDSLGDRMKSYEAVTRSVLLPHSYTILRVDGRSFHSYLRQSIKPFDADFANDMAEVASILCHEVSGTVLAYGQSDEISLVVSDVEPQSQPWFGGVVQKMASVSAAIATAALINQRGIKGMPHFDARVFTLPSVAEVANYLIWRQRDAVRNSISMAAQAKFSTKQLHGVNSGQMQEMLWSQHQINWNDYPDTQKRGYVVTRAVCEEEVTYVHRVEGKLATMMERTFWSITPAPHFTFGEGFLVDALSGKVV